jgi:hypothetical protein
MKRRILLAILVIAVLWLIAPVLALYGTAALASRSKEPRLSGRDRVSCPLVFRLARAWETKIPNRSQFSVCEARWRKCRVAP